MTTPTPNGTRRSWEYPDCPDCGSNVLVEALPSDNRYESYRCWGCRTLFDTDDD